jgi:hypothetical protein
MIGIEIMNYLLLQAESPNPDIASMVLQLIGHIRGIGTILTDLVVWFFAGLGIPIPVQFVNIVMILLIVLTLFKLGSKLSSLILIVLVFVLIANALSLFNFPSI